MGSEMMSKNFLYMISKPPNEKQYFSKIHLIVCGLTRFLNLGFFKNSKIWFGL